MAWQCNNCGKSNNDDVTKCTECFSEKKIEPSNIISETENTIKDKNEWIGNLSIMIALIAMLLPFVFSKFDFLPNIEILAEIAGISLFIGKILNQKNGLLTWFIIFSAIFYFGPVFLFSAVCGNCPG